MKSKLLMVIFIAVACLMIVTLLSGCKKEFNFYQIDEVQKDTVIIVIKPEIPTQPIKKDTTYVHKWKYGNGRNYPLTK